MVYSIGAMIERWSMEGSFLRAGFGFSSVVLDDILLAAFSALKYVTAYLFS